MKCFDVPQMHWTPTIEAQAVIEGTRMPKLFVIETQEVEYHVTAMDLKDAVLTADIKFTDVIAVKEYENSDGEVLH